MKHAVDFEGYIVVEAKNHDEAQNIFWEWVDDLQENISIKWTKVILEPPTFECDGEEEED